MKVRRPLTRFSQPMLVLSLLVSSAAASSSADESEPLVEQLEVIRSEAQAYRQANEDLKAQLDRLEQRLEVLRQQEEQEQQSQPPRSDAAARIEAKSDADPL